MIEQIASVNNSQLVEMLCDKCSILDETWHHAGCRDLLLQLPFPQVVINWAHEAESQLIRRPIRWVWKAGTRRNANDVWRARLPLELFKKLQSHLKIKWLLITAQFPTLNFIDRSSYEHCAVEICAHLFGHCASWIAFRTEQLRRVDLTNSNNFTSRQLISN